jgi:hypothetical protein
MEVTDPSYQPQGQDIDLVQTNAKFKLDSNEVEI